MNASEGLRRIAKLVRWITSGFAAVILTGGIAMALFGDTGARLWVIAISVALSAVLHFGGRGLGWVIDGFAEPKAGQ